MKKVEAKSIDTLQTISADKKQSEIYIKDKSQYDQSFVSSPKNSTF
jgi:hypothetical protein